MTPKLKAAIAKWRDQPAEARRDAIAFFRDEAAQSHLWAGEDAALGNPLEARRHERDAKALRAAVALLKAAQGER